MIKRRRPVILRTITTALDGTETRSERTDNRMVYTRADGTSYINDLSFTRAVVKEGDQWVAIFHVTEIAGLSGAEFKRHLLEGA